MYTNDLKIHKNVDNVLYFQFKNADQRRIPIGNKEFTFIMFDDRESELNTSFELPITIVDAHTGAAKITIPEQYLYDVEIGKYEYSIKVLESDGTTQSTYVDDNFGVRGVVDVQLGNAARFKESEYLTFDSVTNMTDVAGGLTYLHQNNALHTAVLKFDKTLPGFTGDVVVQATLDNITQQVTPNFFDVITYSFVDQVENTSINFNGAFNGVRFLQGVTSGEITQIQYRH